MVAHYESHHEATKTGDDNPSLFDLLDGGE